MSRIVTLCCMHRRKAERGVCGIISHCVGSMVSVTHCCLSSDLFAVAVVLVPVDKVV